MGVKYDIAEFFKHTFEESGVIDHVAMFINLANDLVIERIITPKAHLLLLNILLMNTECIVLVILTDMTALQKLFVKYHPKRVKFLHVKVILVTCILNWLLYMNA